MVQMSREGFLQLRFGCSDIAEAHLKSQNLARSLHVVGCLSTSAPRNWHHFHRKGTGIYLYSGVCCDHCHMQVSFRKKMHKDYSTMNL